MKPLGTGAFKPRTEAFRLKNTKKKALGGKDGECSEQLKIGVSRA